MRILGLDIGVNTVRGVELQTSLGRFEVYDHHEEPVLADESPFDAAARLIHSLSREPNKIAVSIASNKVTFRSIELPTKNKKEIEAGIQFSLEDDVPFEVDDAVFDYTLLKREGKISQYHISATLKTHVAEYLEELKKHSIDPDLVTTESWAYENILGLKPVTEHDPELPSLVVRLGENHSTFHAFLGPEVLFTSESQWGGSQITHRIAKKYHISEQEAEKAKIDHGFILSEEQKQKAEEDHLQFSRHMERAYKDLIGQMKQNLLSAQTQTSKKVGHIFISGGPSLMPGLRAYIEERVGIPVDHLRPMSTLGSNGITYTENTEAHFGLATGLAASLANVSKIRAINFRKGEFSKGGSGAHLDLTKARIPLIATSVITTVLLVTTTVQHFYYQSEIKKLDDQIERHMKPIFGYLSPSAAKGYLRSPTRLTEAIDKKIKEARMLSSLFTPNPHSPLESLNELSKIFPKMDHTDLIRFQIGSGTGEPFQDEGPQSFKISFHTPKKEDAVQILRSLKQVMAKVELESDKEIASTEGTKIWEFNYMGSLSGE